MEKPVQWMTLQELRDELERSRPAVGVHGSGWRPRPRPIPGLERGRALSPGGL